MCNELGPRHAARDSEQQKQGVGWKGGGIRLAGRQVQPRHASNLMCHQFLPPLQMIFIRQKTQASCKKAELDRDRLRQSEREGGMKEVRERQYTPRSCCVSPKTPSAKLEKIYTHKKQLTYRKDTLMPALRLISIAVTSFDSVGKCACT